MNQESSPADVQAPSGKKLLISTLWTLVAAAVLLVLFVLPAEYGIDPTGLGKAMGLTDISGEPTRTIVIRDVVGGNVNLTEVEVPDFGEPYPLPNPAVFQDQAEHAKSETIEVVIPPEAQTEVKLYMQEGKVVVYSWSVDQGDIYVDYHGHDQAFGDEFWVRYKEQQEGSGNHGSLTAPFKGEHGWFWLNYNEFPVTVTLEVTGYYDEVIDYGIF